MAESRIAATIARDSEILPTVLASDGAGSGLDADLLDGNDASAFWQLRGNAGTTPGTHFVGTTDDRDLELHVNGTAAVRIESTGELDSAVDFDPNADGALNVIHGAAVNAVAPGVVGATIGGGGAADLNRFPRPNRVEADYATIGGSFANAASGSESTVGGGGVNTASGEGATVPGGRSNDALGDFSFAAGRRAKANHDGTFVWADSGFAEFASTAANQFLIRADGGVGVNTNAPGAPVHVEGGVDVSLTPTGNGYLMLGNPASLNVALDDNEIMARNNADTAILFLNADGGPVNIGTKTPSTFALLVGGDAAKPGGGSWSNASDGRLKDVGERFTRGLEALEGLEPVHYRYREGNPLGLPSDREYVGLVAQQVETAIPEALEPNDTGYLHVNNDPILWAMLNGIKELRAQVAAKEARIGRLEERLARLEAQLP